MFRKNDPNEVMTAVFCRAIEAAASNVLLLWPTRIQAWRQRRHHQFGKTLCLLYQVEDGILIHVPGQPTPKATVPISNLFKEIPINKVSTSFLEMGEWLGDEDELDLLVSLYIGPDGKVWAEVGDLADLPLLPIKEQESLAIRILDDFTEVYTIWAQEQKGKHPSVQNLRSWPILQMTHWLQETVGDPEIRDAHPEMHLLMRGVLCELESLGVTGVPEAVDGSNIALQTAK